MAVRRIGVERNVGEDSDFGNGILDRPDRLADQIVTVECFLGSLGSKLFGRVREQSDAGNAKVRRFVRLGADLIDAPPADAGQ